MKKSEITKELNAIRKIEIARGKLASEVQKREKALGLACCPWKGGDEIEWTFAGSRERGRVISVGGASVEADRSSGNNYAWSITVHRYKKGTKGFGQGHNDRFHVREGTKRAAALKPYVPDPKEPEPRRFTVSNNCFKGADIKPGEVLELVELKPGYRVVKSRA